jgi:hypothetical protein
MVGNGSRYVNLRHLRNLRIHTMVTRLRWR